MGYQRDRRQPSHLAGRQPARHDLQLVVHDAVQPDAGHATASRFGATDDLGLIDVVANQGRLTINVQVPGDAFPNATITPSGTVNGVQVLHLDLAGAATDDIGVVGGPA